MVDGEPLIGPTRGDAGARRAPEPLDRASDWDPAIPSHIPPDDEELVDDDTTPVRRTRPLRRRPPWLRRLGRGSMVVAVLVAAYYGVTVYQVWSTGRSNQARPVDAIVVLGAAQYDGRPSPQLRGRLDRALDLWRQDLATMVVVTGGKQPGDRFTEAEASAEYLIAGGVPEDAIVLENLGHSTYESLDGVAELLAARGANRALLVTDPFHALRSRLIAQEVGLTAYVAPTSNSGRGGNALWRHAKEAAGVSVGRIIGFRRLTDITG